LQSGLFFTSASGIDAAILDMLLETDSSEPIPELLKGTGIAFASGYGADGCPRGLRTPSLKNHSLLKSLNAVERLCCASKAQPSVAGRGPALPPRTALGMGGTTGRGSPRSPYPAGGIGTRKPLTRAARLAVSDAERTRYLLCHDENRISILPV
jgi:hypothetical protein